MLHTQYGDSQDDRDAAGQIGAVYAVEGGVYVNNRRRFTEYKEVDASSILKDVKSMETTELNHT